MLGADFTASSGASGDAGTRDAIPAAEADTGADAQPPAPWSFDVAGSPALAIGFNYMCAIAANRTLWCWGSGVLGNTGHGESRLQRVPTQVKGLRDVVHVAVDVRQSCAVTEDGAVWCFGDNREGELGAGHQEGTDGRLQRVVDLGDASEVAVGDGFGCALDKATGEVRCWGSNDRGQLAQELGTLQQLRPAIVPGIRHASHIFAKAKRACAQLEDQSVVCWGSNQWGELGLGRVGPEAVFSPTAPHGLGPVKTLKLASLHACALMLDGHVRCWGYNERGEAGVGALSGRTPVPVATEVPHVIATGLVALESGGCIHTPVGKIQCWGRNDSGFLNTVKPQFELLTPSDVMGLAEEPSFLSGGGYNLCANLRSGATQCWGFNSSGQLGNGEMSDVPSAPVNLPAF